MPNNETKANEFRIALEECWNALHDAYWASSTADAKDTITGCSRFISDLLDVMYLQDIKARTNSFTALAAEIEVGNKKLKELQDHIDKLIHNVGAITKVVSSIEKVITYIPLIPF